MSNVVSLRPDADELERLWLDFRSKRQTSLDTLAMADMIAAGSAYGELLAGIARADAAARNALQKRASA